MSRTLSGLFLIGALNRPRKRKRTNRENPRTIPERIGKIPEKSGKSQQGQKRTKKEGQVQIGKPPRLKPPRLAALDLLVLKEDLKLLKKKPACGHPVSKQNEEEYSRGRAPGEPSLQIYSRKSDSRTFFCRKSAKSNFQPAKSKRGREEGDGTENVINCRKLS